MDIISLLFSWTLLTEDNDYYTAKEGPPTQIVSVISFCVVNKLLSWACLFTGEWIPIVYGKIPLQSLGNLTSTHTSVWRIAFKNELLAFLSVKEGRVIMQKAECLWWHVQMGGIFLQCAEKTFFPSTVENTVRTCAEELLPDHMPDHANLTILPIMDVFCFLFFLSLGEAFNLST